MLSPGQGRTVAPGLPLARSARSCCSACGARVTALA